MTKYKQTDLRQTGIAVVETFNGEIINVPLFSSDIIKESMDLSSTIPNLKKVSKVFSFNTLTLDFNNKLKEYKEQNGILSQDLMDSLRTGIWSTENVGYPCCITCYK